MNGRLGLSQNRLPAQTSIEDVAADDIVDLRGTIPKEDIAAGRAAIIDGQVAVLTLSAALEVAGPAEQAW